MTSTTSRTVVKAALKVVRLDTLNTDTSYQRGIKPRHKRIIADFDENALGIPLIGEREDASLWIVDGLQRITALRKMDRKEARCEIFRSDGPEHEAEIFKFVNLNRTKLTVAEEFQALLTAGDALAWQIKETVESLGYKLLLNNHGRGKGVGDVPNAKNLICVNTLRRVSADAERGIEALGMCLRMADAAWPGDAMGINSSMIAGLSTLYKRLKGVIDEERLLPRLRTTTPYKIIYAANQQNISGGDKASSMADVLEKIYHRRLSKAKS